MKKDLWDTLCGLSSGQKDNMFESGNVTILLFIFQC